MLPTRLRASQFSRVCPSYKQRVYSLKNDENPSGELDLVPGGQARIHQLQVLLAGSDVGCIRMEGEVFDDAYVDSVVQGHLPTMKAVSSTPEPR